MGGDEHGGRESLGGLDRPEPVASGGADDGLGLPRPAGLDLLDGIGHGQRRDHGLVSGPHGRDHPLCHLRRRQRPRGVVNDDDVGLRHGGQGRCEPEGHGGLPGAGRAGHDLDLTTSARRGPDRSVRQALELGAEPVDLLSGGGDDDVADGARGDEPGRRPSQEADAAHRDEGLGDPGAQAGAGARRGENGDRPTRSGLGRGGCLG